ncbi:MAG TPA: hypothetical protein V6C93_21405, partial [Allocoleopsis sp.]
MITRSNRLTLTEGRGTHDKGQVTEEPCDGKLSRTVLKGRRGVAISPADPNNMDSATRLQKILVDSPVGAVLPAIALLNLPNWWLAGGAVRNTVWR